MTTRILRPYTPPRYASMQCATPAGSTMRRKGTPLRQAPILLLSSVWKVDPERGPG